MLPLRVADGMMAAVLPRRVWFIIIVVGRRVGA